MDEENEEFEPGVDDLKQAADALCNNLDRAHEMTYVGYEEFVDAINAAGFTAEVCEKEFAGVKYEDIDVSSDHQRLVTTFFKLAELIETKSNIAMLECI